jgi:hypothetical protein
MSIQVCTCFRRGENQGWGEGMLIGSCGCSCGIADFIVSSNLGSGAILHRGFPQRVVAGNLVLLAAFSCRRTKPAPVLCEVILHLHSDDSVHAVEGIAITPIRARSRSPVSVLKRRESLRPTGKSDSDLFWRDAGGLSTVCALSPLCSACPSQGSARVRGKSPDYPGAASAPEGYFSFNSFSAIAYHE